MSSEQKEVLEQSNAVEANSSSAQVVNKPITTFVEPSVQPTQVGPDGIRFDFNFGCRVELPVRTDGEKWKLRMSDLETSNVIFECESEGGIYRSTKVYYIPFRLECWVGDRKLFEHSYSCKGMHVQIQIPVGTLGDSIAWFPYVDLFQKKHDCELTCVISEKVADLFKESYPNIRFMTLKDAELVQKQFYATYRMGLFFDDFSCTHQPVDFRYVGLHKTAAHILGVPDVEVAPNIHLPSNKRKIIKPYVCIAVQSSTQCKYWNNPHGWRDIVKWLKEKGYRVLCIDKDAAYGQGVVWNHIPHGAEDMTGEIPLTERAELLKHADFFIGLSSGLAWLAWAVGTPVVMISGFTHPNNEFYTPYRVYNHHPCNSCWNDPKQMFDHFDFLWCPKHKGTDRQFECTRLITVDHVKSVIEKIPGFKI